MDTMDTLPYDYEAEFPRAPQQRLQASPAFSTAPTLHFSPMARSPEEIPPTQPSPESPATGASKGIDEEPVAAEDRAETQNRSQKIEAIGSQSNEDLKALAAPSSEQIRDLEALPAPPSEQIPDLEALAPQQIPNLKAPLVSEPASLANHQQIPNLEAQAALTTMQVQDHDVAPTQERNLKALAAPEQQIPNPEALAALANATTANSEAIAFTPIKAVAMERANSSTPLSGSENFASEVHDLVTPERKSGLGPSKVPDKVASQAGLQGHSHEGDAAAAAAAAAAALSPQSAVTEDLLQMKALLQLVMLEG